MHLYPNPPLSLSPPFSLATAVGTMKHSFQYYSHGILPFLLLAFFLCICTTSASRLLASPLQGRDEVKVAGFPQVGHLGEMEGEGSWNLLGLEDCDNGDEQCLKRRMISEAHLDYIYTQHRKP